MQKLTTAWRQAGAAARMAQAANVQAAMANASQMRRANGQFMSTADTQAALRRLANFSTRARIMMGAAFRAAPSALVSGLNAAMATGRKFTVSLVNGLNTARIGAGQFINDLKGGFSKVQSAASKVASVVSAIGSAGMAAAKAVVSIGTAAVSVGGSITRGILVPLQKAIGLASRVGSGLRKAGGMVGGAVSGLATGAGLATVGIGIASIKNAAAFQEQMAIIDTIFQETPERVRELGRQLQKTAYDTGQTIQDITTSTYEFLSAGIGRSASFVTVDAQGKWKQTGQSIKQVAIATRAASMLAVGGLSSQTEAVIALSYALNSFNLNQARVSKATATQAGVFVESENGTRRYARSMAEASVIISDQFAKAVEIGVVKASEIATSLSTVAASAKVAGIGVDEIAAAYATQTVRGVSARRVTTSMNRAIIDLLKPGKQLVDLMDKTGKNYAKIADEKGLHVAFQTMRNDAKTAGVDFVTLFKRQEGWRFALNMTADDMNDKAGDYQLYIRNLQEIRRSEGAAEAQAKRRSDTVVRNAGRVKIAFQIMTEAIGYPLLRPLNEALKMIARLQISIADWARANEKFIEQMGPIIGFVGVLLALTAGTQGLLYVLAPIAPMLGTTSTALRGTAMAIGRVTAPIAILVGLLGAFKYLVENNVRGFGMFTRQLDDMKALAAGVINVFRTIGEAIQYVWDTLGRGGDVGAAISKSMDLIGQSVEDLGPVFMRVLKFIAAFALNVGKLVVDALAKAIPAIAQWFISVAKAILPNVAYLLGVFVGWAQEVVPKIIKALGTFASEVWAWLQKAVPTVVTNFSYLLRKLIDWAGTVVPGIVNALGDLASGIGDWIASTIPTIQRALAGVITRIRDWVGANGPKIVDALSAWANQIANWFANDLFPAVQRGLTAFIERVTSFLKDTQLVRKLVTFVISAIAGLAALIASHAGEIIGLFAEIAGQAIGAFADFIDQHGGELVQAGIRAGAEIIHAIAKFIVEHPAEFIQAVATIILLATAAGAVLSAARSLGAAIIGQSVAGAAAKSLWKTGLSNALIWVFNAVGGVVETAAVKLAHVAGIAFGKAMNVATSAMNWVTATFGPRLTALATTASQLAGTAAGTAFTVALAAAAVAAFAVAWVTVRNQIDEQGKALVQQTKDFINTATQAQLEAALEAARQGRKDLVLQQTATSAILGIGPVIAAATTVPALDSTDKVIADLEARLARLKGDPTLSAAMDALNNKAAEGPKPFNKLMIPGVDTGGYFPTDEQLAASFADQVEKSQQAARDAANAGMDSLLSSFESGVKNKVSGLNLWDWRSILKVDEGTAAGAELAANIDRTFTDLATSISTPTANLTAVLDKYKDKLDKNGKVQKHKYTSDKDRIVAVDAAIVAAQKDLAEAAKHKDTAAQIEITNAIAKLEEQKLGLINAGKVLAEAQTGLATATAAANQNVTGVGGKTAPKPSDAGYAKWVNDERARIRKMYAAAKKEWKANGRHVLSITEWIKREHIVYPELPKPPKIEPPVITEPKVGDTGLTLAEYYSNTYFKPPTTPVTSPSVTEPLVGDTGKTLAQYYADTYFKPPANPTKPPATNVSESTLKDYFGLTAKPVTVDIGGPTQEQKDAVKTAIEAVVSDAITSLETVRTTAQNVVNAAASIVRNVSWYSYGMNMVATLISGIMAMLPALRVASLAAAIAAGTYVEHGSPAKVGPLRNVPKWGREMVNQFAIGMTSGNSLVAAASLGTAGVAAGPLTAFPGFGGQTQIVPMSMGGRGGYGGQTLAERQASDRQVELLAEIASTSRLGAAAAAHGASRDPYAGGPLAARSTLVSLRQMTTTRTRGG